MLIYIAVIIFILLASLFAHMLGKRSEKIKKVLFAFCIFIMFLVMILRNPNEVGKDWMYYKSFFYIQDKYTVSEYTEMNSEYSRFEIGFRLLAKCISTIVLDEKIFLATISAIIMCLVGYSIFKYSKRPFFSLLIYIALDMYFFNFSGLRQSIAMGIILLSYKYIKESNIKKFVFCIAIAMLFHKSAIIFFAAYFIRNYRFSNRNLVFTILMGIVIFVFNKEIFLFVNKIFYSNYQLQYVGAYKWALMCGLLWFYTFFYYNGVCANDDKASMLYNIVTIGMYCLLFSPVATDVLRVANYFYVFIIFLIPEIIDSIKDVKKRTLTIYLLKVAFVGIYIYLLNRDTYNVVPFILW